VRIGLRLPACDRADRVAATAAHAEAAGFDSVWVPDSQLLWRDTFVALAFAAASTTRIALATGVTNLVTRHVTVVASAARTVQELAPGRFTLALGAGRSAADMAGAAHTPTRDLGESLRALRALLSGQPWSFAGRAGRSMSSCGCEPTSTMARRRTRASGNPPSRSLAGDTARTLPHEFIDSFTATGLTS